MKASVTLELITKGLDKARQAKQLIRDVGRAETVGKDLIGTEKNLIKSNERLAESEHKSAKAFDKSTQAAKKQGSEFTKLEQQQDKLRRKSKQFANANGPVRSPGVSSMINKPMVGAAGAAGVGFLSGAGLATTGAVGGLGMVASASIVGAAGDEFEADQLRVLGEYTEAQEKAYQSILKKTGTHRGIGTMGAYAIFGELMAGGLSHKDAAVMTDGVAVFSKAAKSQIEEVARTTIALRNNLAIGNDEMMSAYDAMALGGKDGQFEVKDMAKAFPSLAAKMGKLGENGLAGVKRLVAMSQAVRTATGTSSEAATNLDNLLNKLTAKDFTKNAAKFGIDVEKTMSDAIDNGLSPVLELIKAIQEEVGSNPFALGELLPDSQAQAALTAIIKQYGAINQQIEKMGAAQGIVMKDFLTATDNASSAWDRLFANVATKSKDTAAKVLPVATKVMNYLSDGMEGKPTALSKANQGAKSVSSAIPVAWLGRKIFGDDPPPQMEAYKKYGASRREANQNKLSGRDALSGIVERIDAADRAKNQNNTVQKKGDISGRMDGAFDGVAHEAAEGSAAVKEELTALQIQTFAAGQKAGKQLAAGLRSTKPEVSAAANELASEISAHFPQSPAKKGPLRGLPQMGAKISSQIADGMLSNSAAQAASTVAKRITAGLGGNASGRQSAKPGGVTSGGVQIGSITINGVKDAAGAVDQLGRNIERRLAGVLADVG